MVFITDKLEQNRRAQPLCTSRFAFDPSEIEGALRARIIGQDETITRFKRQLSVVKAGPVSYTHLTLPTSDLV